MESESVFKWVGLNYVLQPLFMIIAYGLILRKKTRLMSAIIIISTLVNIPLNLNWIPPPLWWHWVGLGDAGKLRPDGPSADHHVSQRLENNVWDQDTYDTCAADSCSSRDCDWDGYVWLDFPSGSTGRHGTSNSCHFYCPGLVPRCRAPTRNPIISGFIERGSEGNAPAFEWRRAVLVTRLPRNRPQSGNEHRIAIAVESVFFFNCFLV